MRYLLFIAGLLLTLSGESARSQETITQQQNWTSVGRAGFFPYLTAAIESGQTFHVHSLTKRGESKPSLLSMPVEVQFYGRGDNKQLWEFAALACGSMDWEARSFGAWGRECKISSIIRRPKHGTLMLAKNGNENGFYPEGSYLYNPTRLGKDAFWFLLSNGESRQVEVHYELNIFRFYPEP